MRSAAAWTYKQLTGVISMEQHLIATVYGSILQNAITTTAKKPKNGKQQTATTMKSELRTKIATRGMRQHQNQTFGTTYWSKLLVFAKVVKASSILDALVPLKDSKVSRGAILFMMKMRMDQHRPMYIYIHMYVYIYYTQCMFIICIYI